MKDVIDKDCPICLENMKNSGKLIVKFKNCGHWIHDSCCKNYFEKSKKNTCPTCHTTLVCQKKKDIE